MSEGYKSCWHIDAISIPSPGAGLQTRGFWSPHSKSLSLAVSKAAGPWVHFAVQTWCWVLGKEPWSALSLPYVLQISPKPQLPTNPVTALCWSLFGGKLHIPSSVQPPSLPDNNNTRYTIYQVINERDFVGLPVCLWLSFMIGLGYHYVFSSPFSYVFILQLTSIYY